MSFNLTLGWWALPVVVFLIAAAWTFWPRPDEWKSGGDYSIPSGTITLPLRFLSALVVTLVSIVIWRW